MLFTILEDISNTILLFRQWLTAKQFFLIDPRMNPKTDDRPFLACFLMLTQTAVSPLIDSFLIFQMDFVDFSRFSKIYHAPPMHYGVFDLFAHFVEIAEFFRDSQNRVAPLKVLMLIKKKKKIPK